MTEKLSKKIRVLKNIVFSIAAYRRGKIVLSYLPTALWVEPTNVCNLHCLMCPNSLKKQKKYGHMDINLYRKIINEAKDFASHIVLCISGEPLLHPSFCEMVTLAKKAGLSVYLSTNATVLSSALSKKLLCSGLDWINFSFDGCDKKTYEKIRRGADFEKTLQNIIGFLKIKKALGAKTRTELQILVMDEKGRKNLKSNLSSFKNRFLGLPLDCFQVRTPSTWGRFFLKTKMFIPKKLGRRFSPCSYLWSSLHLLFDGRVVACTSDFFGENVLGKFPEKSLREIWNDKPMQSFRRAMLRKNYLRFNKNCEGCDSLWEKPILGLPAGLRGICASSFSSVFGQGFLGIFKRAAKLFNRDFSMEVIGD